MWARRMIAGALLLSLFALPALAADTETEVLSSVEDSGNASGSDSDPVQTVSLVVLEQTTASIEEDARRINDNLAFCIACIISTGGLIVGYWTGKDLLSIW